MKIARAVALVALGFLGMTAIVGAVPMILHPRGEPWQMRQGFLEHSPFHSFLIPGIILLLANGVLSLLVAFFVMRKRSGYGWWVALQGCILCGWIAVEVVILRMAIWPHYLYAGVGLVLVASGFFLTQRSKPA